MSLKRSAASSLFSVRRRKYFNNDVLFVVTSSVNCVDRARVSSLMLSWLQARGLAAQTHACSETLSFEFGIHFCPHDVHHGAALDGRPPLLGRECRCRVPTRYGFDFTLFARGLSKRGCSPASPDRVSWDSVSLPRRPQPSLCRARVPRIRR